VINTKTNTGDKGQRGVAGQRQIPPKRDGRQQSHRTGSATRQQKRLQRAVGGRRENRWGEKKEKNKEKRGKEKQAYSIVGFVVESSWPRGDGASTFSADRTRRNL